MAHEKRASSPDRDAANVPDDVVLVEAKHAADTEHSMSLLKAIKLYPKAIGWSVLLSSTLIMEGYDLALLGSLYASPVFNKKFGEWSEAKGKYAVSAAWQSGLSNGARAGEIFGLLIAGWTADKFGYKKTTIGMLMAMICFIFVLFFAPNVKVLVVGEILCGKLYSPPYYWLRVMKLTIYQVSHGELSRVSRQPTPPRLRPWPCDHISQPYVYRPKHHQYHSVS